MRANECYRDFSPTSRTLIGKGSVLVASSRAAFVWARRVVRPGQPHATYALGDDKAAALAISPALSAPCRALRSRP